MDGTLLAIISGRDRPGVTAAVFDALRHTRAVVLDMEQLVVRGRLILAVLLGVDTANVGDVRAVVHEVATRVGMEVETLPGAPEEVAASRGRINVTVMGAPLPPERLPTSPSSSPSAAGTSTASAGLRPTR